LQIFKNVFLFPHALQGWWICQVTDLKKRKKLFTWAFRMGALKRFSDFPPFLVGDLRHLLGIPFSSQRTKSFDFLLGDRLGIEKKTEPFSAC